jgi:FixJ family two-component response regulator
MSARQGAVVAVVEDDPGMREALRRRLSSAGFDARAYSSAEDFLETGAAADLGCLVVDVGLPGVSGLELQRRLIGMGRSRPVIFITAHDTAAARKEADELDAVAFLAKPFEGRLLVDAVDEALARKEYGGLPGAEA